MNADQILDEHGIDGGEPQAVTTAPEPDEPDDMEPEPEEPAPKAKPAKAKAKTEEKADDPEPEEKVVKVRPHTRVIRKGVRLTSDGNAPEFDATDPDDSPEEPETPEAAEEPAPPPEPTAADVAPVPWSFGWGRGQVQIPGALEKPGYGVFIPEGDEALGHVRQQLLLAQKVPKLRATIADMEKQVSQGVTRQGLENASMAKVLGPILSSREGFVKWFTEAQQNPESAHERLSLALQREQINIDREVGANLIDAAPRDGLSPAEVDDAYATLGDTFEEAVRKEWPAIDAETKHKLAEAVVQNAKAFWRQAGSDDPAGRWLRGGLEPNLHLLTTFIRGEKASRPAPSVPPARPAQPTPVIPPKPVQKAPTPPPMVGGSAKAPAISAAVPPKKKGGEFNSRAAVVDFWEK